MEFVSRHFIALNAVVVTLLVISFLRMRRASQEKLIKLRNPEAGSKQIIVKRFIPDDDDPRLKKDDGPRVLNVMFNYNGHSWDAYEVLGVPAGSNFENSFQAFEKLTRTMDEESKSFMLAALEAIRIARQRD